MRFHPPSFVTNYQDQDPKLHTLVQELEKLAMEPGSLDLKTKLLMVLALDAFKGSELGVEALAKQARKAGASEEEILETLRIACFISTMDCLRAGSAAQGS